jgi:predicted RNase H-like nuclease
MQRQSSRKLQTKLRGAEDALKDVIDQVDSIICEYVAQGVKDTTACTGYRRKEKDRALRGDSARLRFNVYWNVLCF